jgi:uncharacterized protein YdcH (DUF465 family)
VDKKSDLAEEIKKKDAEFDKLMDEYDKDIPKLKDSILENQEKQ